MEYTKHHRWAQFALVAIILLVIIFGWQFSLLEKAHSTFDNYAAFRGCAQITSQSDTSGTCTLPSGETIKIVKFHGKWYLDGDLPACWLDFCF